MFGNLIRRQYEKYMLNELGKLYLRGYKKEMRKHKKDSNEIRGILYLIEHPEILKKIVDLRKQALNDKAISRRIWDKNDDLYFALKFLGEYSLARKIKRIQKRHQYNHREEKKYLHEWYQKHKEERREYMKKYRQEHKINK